MSETSTPLWNQFIIIKNFNQYPMLSSLLIGYEGENLIGYTYIDHEQGITLDILKLFTENNREYTINKDLVEDRSRAILRFEQFSDIDFEIATSQISDVLKPEIPEYIKQYDRDDLIAFREHTIYQKFTAEGFPDDIAVYLIDETNKFKTEHVWVRTEYFDVEKQAGLAKLLVQPFQKLEVEKGDNILFKLVEVKEENMGFQPFGFIIKRRTEETTKAPQEKEDKKWWKFW